MSETTKHPRKHVNSYDRGAPTPEVGSRWIWERGRLAQETITVTDVKWNGEEWWVESVAPSPALLSRTPGGVMPGKPYWNDLGRFWEAVSALA